MITSRSLSRSTLIRIGELELNTTARVVSCRDEVMALTPREYRLLEFLAQRAGEVVSRTEIEEHIYSDEKDLFSNAVESAISVLRKKFEAAGCGPLIHTRRGMGYVLQAA